MAYMKKETENRLLDLLTEATQVTKTLTDRVLELEATNAFLTGVLREMTTEMNVVTKKFPRYMIDPESGEFWCRVMDLTNLDIGSVAAFAVSEHAQEWVENHQEWLDYNPTIA